MSYTTITQCSRDREFTDRVTAAVAEEAWNNPTLAGTQYAQNVKASPESAATLMFWPLSIDNKDAYEYAVNAANPSPGGDPTVITDAAILAGVQEHWPDKPAPMS